MNSGNSKTSKSIIIKKYANRRLYNTNTSSYITLEHLCHMVKNNIEFTVLDAKTEEDITRAVLTQIIVEEENKGQNLLPISFLRQVISFYGDNLQFLLPRYLEQSMSTFVGHQEQIRQYMKNAFGNLFSFSGFDEIAKQNNSFFEGALKMFSPFDKLDNEQNKNVSKNDETSNQLNLLQQQVLTLKKQIEELNKSSVSKKKNK
ncbi:MAG: polyhydroxyalkanoate synthesis repressor PhaR [Alphaproteobacteria bacterium]|nr:polyhydroxyalkanoate synthesis repressor PhaR [Alphaproteobacteria bacterium]